MTTGESRGRAIAGRVLVLCAALLAVAAVVGGYVRFALLDEHQFSQRSVAALQQPEVRLWLGREITDEVVLHADPDLVAARPILQSLAGGLVGTAAFQSVFSEAVRRVHESLVSGRSSRIELDLRDAGILLDAALQRVRPQLAAELRLDDVVLEQDRLERVTRDVASTADGLRVLPWILLGIAVLLGGLGLALAPDRRVALRDLGGGIAAFAVLGLVLLRIAGRAVTARLAGGDDVLKDALDQIREAFLGDLRNVLLLSAGFGVVLVAAAASVRPVPALEPLLRRAWQIVAEPAPGTWRRALRAVVVAALGIALLVDRAAVIAFVLSLLGLGLLYAGVAELLRIVQERVGSGRRAAAQAGGDGSRGARSLAPVAAGIVAAAIAGVGIAAFVATGAAEAPKEPPIGCNGHEVLCDRTFDRVALLATHNAMSAADQPGWFSAEQDAGIPAQLAEGVRGLLIDAHYGERVRGGGVKTDLNAFQERAAAAGRQEYLDAIGPAGLAAIERIRDRQFTGPGARGVYLCHTFCELGALDMTTTMRSVERAVAANPNDVFLIVVEDYVSPEDVVRTFRESGLDQYVYRGPKNGPFPTLQQMVDSDQRVVVYSENEQGAAPWYTKAYDGAMRETPYDTPTAAQLVDPAKLPASCAANRGLEDSPLFLMNHWVATSPLARPSNARKVNRREAIVARARECRRLRGELPTVVAVDFFRQGDALGAVDELNGVGAG